MNIAGREVPTPVVAVGGLVGGYGAYRWWKGRKAAAAGATNSTSGTAEANPDPTTVVQPVYVPVGKGPVGGGGPNGPTYPDLAKYANVTLNEANLWSKAGAPVFQLNAAGQLVAWDHKAHGNGIWVPWTWVHAHTKVGQGEATDSTTAGTDAAAAAAASPSNKASAAPQPGVTATTPTSSAPSSPATRPVGQGSALVKTGTVGAPAVKDTVASQKAPPQPPPSTKTPTKKAA